eukprot:CAMPEP_0119304024 /NCGR_PEP_ID=MMETSP1333-20130426/5343_1 /TAXON_ID=418940 /ORGANISM="Scyphosphaera apsteinii, Strain RCC1455" /LENGTH=243 /DNA_ID=CAMNT_0007306829 /DNA_START=47 /DNA_END=778 /DNA_ORIENTATION=-
MQNPVLGYHKIRGLAAALRMMFFYKGQPFTNVAFGSDMKEMWFGGKKPGLVQKNSLMNLPYIIDGDTTITQSNTCLLYLGKKLGIDTEEAFFHNHAVLDQTMDLRNDLMKVVYPFGSVKTKDEFPAAANKHMESATAHFTKLEGFCKGPYMCGSAPQSGDFHVFEMLDQHSIMCTSLGLPCIMESFPALKVLHASMKAEPALAKYYESDMYVKYAHNNGLFTHFTGQGDDFVYGPTVEELIQP